MTNFLTLPYFVRYCSSQSSNAFNILTGPKRWFWNYWLGLVNIRQRPLTEATSLQLFVSLIVLSRRDKAFLNSLRNFHSYSSNRRNSICFMMFGWKRRFKKLRECDEQLFGFQPILTILFVSPIVLSPRYKAFLTSLRNFKSYLSNMRNSICFMMIRWKRTYE